MAGAGGRHENKGITCRTHSQTEASGYGCGIDCQEDVSKERVGKTFVFPIQAPPTLDRPSFLPGVKTWRLEYLLLP